MTELCLPLNRLRASDLPVAGGKGANLGELVAAGFDVPDGFVVTTAAYRLAVGAVGVPDRDAVRAQPVPADIVSAVIGSYLALGGGAVAVRSSATAEDLPGAAFAGQQDTYLGVIGEQQLIEAVRDCWASLWTERAISYRDRLAIAPDGVAIAVVVQRMVQADHAGVMFTADPVTGARDHVVIDANPGLGEAVVAGLVTPDHAVLDADDQVIMRFEGRREVVIRTVAGGGTESVAGEPQTAGLTDAELAGLADVGRRIAAHFGRPQDIEWAIAGGRIAIVQARPMTALPPPPISLSRIQRFTGPVILELLPRRPYPLELTAWTGTIGGHLQGMIGGIIGARANFDAVLITRDDVVTGYVPVEPRPTVRTPLRLVRTLGRLGRNPRAWRHDERFRRYLAGAERLALLDPQAASWAELLAVPGRAAGLIELITDLRVGYLPAAAAAMVRLRLLLGLLGRSDLFAALLLEFPTETTRANDELAALADEVRAQPERAKQIADLPAPDALELIRTDPGLHDLNELLSGFLARYGHRETGSVLLLREPPWADEPATVIALVQLLLAGEPGSGGSPFEAALCTLLQLSVVRRTRTGHWVRRLVARASTAVQLREDTHFELTRTMPPVRHAVLEVARRLAAAGAIDSADDAWFLTWPEIQALPDPRLDPPALDLRAAVERRRAAFAELSGAPLIATATLYPGRDDTDALVTGAAGGGGTAVGPARVIHGPADFHELRPGDVLVCPATNPSWTPLFTRAAAVVVDHGGVASHAAIVAREYGIPAVMGTGNGTTLLASGTRVRVDGDRGRVTLP